MRQNAPRERQSHAPVHALERAVLARGRDGRAGCTSSRSAPARSAAPPPRALRFETTRACPLPSGAARLACARGGSTRRRRRGTRRRSRRTRRRRRLPRASAFKRALTSSIAAVCAPGCAYLDGRGRVFSSLSVETDSSRLVRVRRRLARGRRQSSSVPSRALSARSPSAARASPGASAESRERPRVSPGTCPRGRRCCDPRLFVPTHRTTTPGGCRKLSSPSRILRSTFCVRSPLIPNALASFSGNHFSNTARLPASSS